MNPDKTAEITEWLRLRRHLKLDLIPFHISQLVEDLKGPKTPGAVRMVAKHVIADGWFRFHSRRDGRQVWLYAPDGWREEKNLASARNRRRPKLPIPRQWLRIAAGLIRGGRVIVRDREAARNLTAGLQTLKARGEIYGWRDGRCVVTNVGTPPHLMAICRCCRMGQCADCQHGYRRGQGYSPVRCECEHAEFLYHVGYPRLAKVPGPMRTRAKGTLPPNKG